MWLTFVYCSGAFTAPRLSCEGARLAYFIKCFFFTVTSICVDKTEQKFGAENPSSGRRKIIVMMKVIQNESVWEAEAFIFTAVI